MFYRCPKCGAYHSVMAWSKATSAEGPMALLPLYCCPSCGEASAWSELQTPLARLVHRMAK